MVVLNKNIFGEIIVLGVIDIPTLGQKLEILIYPGDLYQPEVPMCVM